MDRKLNKKRRKLIGELLHLERKRKDILQESIAQVLDIRQDQISKIESGKRRIDVVELMVYCEALGLSPTQFAAKIETYLHGRYALHTCPNMKYQKGLCAMEKVRVDVSWSDENYSASFGENIPFAVKFTANTFPELPEEALESLDSQIKRKVAGGDKIPQWLRDGQYVFLYKFMDARSLLTAYGQYLSLAAISRASGINQNLLSLYANGKKKACPHQVERIAYAINKIGKELMKVVP